MLLIVEDNPETVTRTTLSRTPRSPVYLCLRHPLSLSRNGGAIDLDFSDVHEAAPPMSAARQQVGEADLVHAAQVRFLDPGSARDDALDVERQPADRRNRELALQKQCRVGGGQALAVVADEPRSVRELQHRADNVEARRAGDPADPRKPGKVDIAGPVAQRGGHAGHAD